MIKPRPLIPLLAATTLPGVQCCTDTEGVLGALASGSKQILAGRSVHELAPMLPIPHATDVLHLVAESRVLHGDKMAAELAHALYLRVSLSAQSKPILQLALAELLQNAIEHGNLGLSLTRHQQVDDMEWFEAYHHDLNKALNGPLGRIPVRISCRSDGGELKVEIEDRGLGFAVRETMARISVAGEATGRGVGLLNKLLKGKFGYEAGGRVARFALELEKPTMTVAPPNLRSTGRVVGWAASAARGPILERAMRSAGCQNFKAVNNLRDLVNDANNAHILIIDADTANFASVGYALADLQAQAPHTPILLWAPRAIEAVLALALRHKCMDVALAGISANELGLRLERLLQTSGAMNTERTMIQNQKEEVERTRSFQHDMMPKAGALAQLAENHNIQLATSYQGCETLAGDYWSITETGPHHIALAMMDFTGHGVRAALNMVQLHALLKNEWNTADPVGIATSLNISLHGLLGPGCFAAYVYGVLDTHSGVFTYCAGGAPPLLLKTKTGAVKELIASGLPLGLAPKIQPMLRSTVLGEGETLMIYSDALTDAPHRNGERWGQVGLVNTWQQFSCAMHARNALQALLEAFHASVTLPVPDDLTVLVVKR
jgi:sigma-B regulation protein RsbU (phosphoserine phosphatase)